MLSTKLLNLLNEQIKHEFDSEHLYLAMGAYLASNMLGGFAHFYIKHSAEEHGHAMRIFKFINDKGERVTLTAVDEPKNDFKSVVEIVEETLEHERMVTKIINELTELALKEKEHSTVNFLKEFVDEQVEEELLFEKLLNTLQRIGKDGTGLIMLDKELEKRE